MSNDDQVTKYIYTYACKIDEMPLCKLELRSLFGNDPTADHLESGINIDPSRSPFIKGQVAALYEGSSIDDIAKQAEALQLEGSTFKIICVKNDSIGAQTDPAASDFKVNYDERRAMEREIGRHIHGASDMHKPDRIFGLIRAGGRWLFGDYRTNEAVWLYHQKKPRSYSTALNTRVARAVVNIAAPNPAGMKVIDPCCGIGTVVVEALSMGIDIVGSDMNPLAISGARTNLAYFGLPDVVSVAAIQSVSGRYDAAILDLPYNICSEITPDEQFTMLMSVRSLASRVVVISTEAMDSMFEQAGLIVIDRCHVKKGNFYRHIVVCS